MKGRVHFHMHTPVLGVLACDGRRDTITSSPRRVPSTGVFDNSPEGYVKRPFGIVSISLPLSLKTKTQARIAVTGNMFRPEAIFVALLLSLSCEWV